MRYYDIYNEVLKKFPDQTDNTKASVKIAVNNAYNITCQMIGDAYFLRKRGTIALAPPHSTGTVTATHDSATITGSGTTFGASMVGRKISIQGDSTAYKISAYTSATSITIETAYKGTTGSSLTYSINKDIYQLADRCSKLMNVRQVTTPSKIYEVDSREFNEILPGPYAKGTPQWYKLIEPTSSAYYSTGTATTVDGSVTVAGGSTAWTSALIGRLIKFTGHDNEYEISAVGTTTSLTLTGAYTGTAVATATYQISPAGIPQIQFYYLPDDAIQVEYDYIVRPLPLMADNDVPIIPPQFQWVLIDGGHFMASFDKDRNVGIADRAEKRFYDGIKQIIAWNNPSSDKGVIIRPSRLGNINNSKIYNPY